MAVVQARGVFYRDTEDRDVTRQEGIENQRAAVAMQLFEELDAWMKRMTDGRVDTMVLGFVGGAVSV